MSRQVLLQTTNQDAARVMSQRLSSPDWAPKPKFPGVGNGHAIGIDNRSGKPIVKPDSGHAIKVTANRNGVFINGQQAEINHDNSAPGSRVVVSRFGVQIITQAGVGNTVNKENQSDLDNCDDLGNPNSNPDEPEEPEEPQPPSEPIAPGPDDPDEPEEPQPPGEGCYPDDDCQWYNASSGDASNCPLGTTYKGFAELTGGNFKVLCCGENRPAGDGCPDDPDTYGWQCVNGTCEQLPAGLFATKAECETNCNQDEQLSWAVDNCNCTFVGEGGSYLTLAECQENLPNIEGCGPTTGPGNCEGIRYSTRAVARRANGNVIDSYPRITHMGPLAITDPYYTTDNNNNLARAFRYFSQFHFDTFGPSFAWVEVRHVVSQEEIDATASMVKEIIVLNDNGLEDNCEEPPPPPIDPPPNP